MSWLTETESKLDFMKIKKKKESHSADKSCGVNNTDTDWRCTPCKQAKIMLLLSEQLPAGYSWPIFEKR